MTTINRDGAARETVYTALSLISNESSYVDAHAVS